MTPTFPFFDRKIYFEKVIELFGEVPLTSAAKSAYDPTIFGKYRLPNIVLSPDDEKSISELTGISEVLGAYGKVHSSQQEGYVYLFYNTIIKCARDLSPNLITGHETNQLAKYTAEIVAIHELVHWLVDIDLISNGHTLKYSSDDEKDYHEALAQYFAWLTVQEDAQLFAAFELLEKNQPKRYNLWRQIPKLVQEHHGITLSDIVALKKESFKAIRLSLNPGLQSFENLKWFLIHGGWENTIKSGKFGL